MSGDRLLWSTCRFCGKEIFRIDHPSMPNWAHKEEVPSRPGRFRSAGQRCRTTFATPRGRGVK